MEPLPELFEVAKDKYDSMTKLLDRMYAYAGSGLKVSKEEMFEEFDVYIQALLSEIAVADEKVFDIEINFVRKIVKHDLFKNLSVDKLPKSIEEMKSFSNEILIKIPAFIELSVLCDKKVDSELKVIDPTYCQTVYDGLRRLMTYITFVDGMEDDVEERTQKIVLKPIIDYYKKKYVRYAPKRKED